MIHARALRKIKQILISDSGEITYQMIASHIGPILRDYGIPASFIKNEIRYGNLFQTKTVECMQLLHPEHRYKYKFYVFVLSYQGNISFLDIYVGGTSQMATTLEAKQQAGNISSLPAGYRGAVVGTLIGSAINGNLTKTSHDYEIEKQWYTIIEHVFDREFSE